MFQRKTISVWTMFLVGVSSLWTTAGVANAQNEKQDGGRTRAPSRTQTQPRGATQPRAVTKPNTTIKNPKLVTPQRTTQPPTTRPAPTAGNTGSRQPTFSGKQPASSGLQPRTSEPPVASGNTAPGNRPQKLQFGSSGKAASGSIVAPNRTLIGNAHPGGKPNRLQFGAPTETLSTQKPLNQGNVVGNKPLPNRLLQFGDGAASLNLGAKPLAGSTVANPGKPTGPNLQNGATDLRDGDKPNAGTLTDSDTAGGKKPLGERPTLVGSQRLNRRLGLSGTFVPPPLPGLPQAAPPTAEQLNDLIEAGVIQAKPLPESPVPVNPNQPYEELGDVAQGKPGANGEVVEGPTDPRLEKPEGGFPDLNETALDKPGKPGANVEDPGDRVVVVIIDEVAWNHNYPDYCHWWWHFCPTVRYCPPAQCVTYNCGQVLADYRLESGEVISDVRWWLGVTGMALPKIGFGVQAVDQGSPAEEIGLQPGMIITHANDIELVDADALAQAIEQSNGVLNVKVRQAANGPAAEATIYMVQIKERKF